MAEVCNQCGTRSADWEDDPDAFVAYFYECPGCARLEGERDNVPEGSLGVHYGLETQEEAMRRIEGLGNTKPPGD
jgi:hypothetical protein